MFTKTVRKEFHKQDTRMRAAMVWLATGTVIRCDESSFTLFSTTERVYVWRTPNQADDQDCLLPTLKHGSSVILCRIISWYSMSSIVTWNYVQILCYQVHPMLQHWRNLQNDNTTAVTWSFFGEHANEIFTSFLAITVARVPYNRNGLCQKWCKISLYTIQDLYLSISGRIQATMEAKAVPTPC